MSLKHSLSSAVLFAITWSAGAQSTDYSQQILLPLAPGRVAGAHGSEWLTELAITNMGTDEVRIVNEPPDFCMPLCEPYYVSERSSVLLESVYATNAVRGALLTLEYGDLKDLAITLRTRDLSRQHETWGTGIPVVSRDDLYASTFGLVDVPMEAGFRSTVRIYDFDSRTPAAVRVRVYAMNAKHPSEQPPYSETLLLDITPTFSVPPPHMVRLAPSSAEIALEAHPALLNAGRVRIQIDPLNGSADYWAFASITHNETQFITLVTPK